MTMPSPAFWRLPALLFALLTGTAQAGWFFVAPDGSDGASGRSVDSAFETVQKALEEAQPGDTVVLQPGRYAQDIRTVRAGRPGAPIRLVGPPDAVIVGAGRAYVVEIRHSHVVLSGFSVDGQVDPGESANDFRDKLVYAQGDHGDGGLTGVVIEHLSLRNARGECLRLKGDAVDNEIADNDISDCGLGHYRFDHPVKSAEGIYIGTADDQIEGDRPDRSTGNRVLRNHIRDTGECIDIKEGSSGTRVAGNVCLRQKDPLSGGISVRSNRNLIEGNLVDRSTGAGIRLGGDAEDQGIDNVVRHNQLQYNVEGGLKIMRTPQAEICGNVIRQPADFREVRFGDDGSVEILDECSMDSEGAR